MDLIKRGKKIAEAKRKNPTKYQGGNVPFGYKKKGKELETDAIANEVIEKIIEYAKASQKGERKLSTRKIADFINNKYEFSISHTTVWRIINNKKS